MSAVSEQTIAVAMQHALIPLEGLVASAVLVTVEMDILVMV